MSRPRQSIIDGRKFCGYHGDWHPVADFERQRQSRDGTVPTFRAHCRLAEQTIRDRDRAIDPARAAIVGRSKALAGDLSKALGRTISYHFVLDELHWVGLIPYLRAAIADSGTCLNCGKHNGKAEDYHLAHIIPAPHLAAWAYQHARNLRCLCPGCNTSQGPNPTDAGWMTTEHRKWMTVRHWADQAGQPGWPDYESAFGAPSRPALAGPVDGSGNPLLFA